MPTTCYSSWLLFALLAIGSPVLNHLGIQSLRGCNVFQETASYRTGGFDEVNSLYLFLRFHGIEVQYSDILNALAKSNSKQASLSDLRRIACQFGMQCKVYKGSPSDLAGIETPIIVHIDSLSSANSRFCVMLPGTGVELVDGADAMIVEPPADEFRRAWSGYYLAPGRSSVSIRLIFSMIILCSATIGFFFIVARRNVTGGGRQ